MGRREPGLNVLVLRRGEREPLEPPGGLMLLKPQHRSADAASRVHQAWRTRRGASCLVSVVSGCCGFEALAQLPVKELVVLDLLSVRTRDRVGTRVRVRVRVRSSRWCSTVEKLLPNHRCTARLCACLGLGLGVGVGLR